MPLAPDLLPLVQDARFWTDVWFLTDADEPRPALEGCVLRFEITDRYALTLSVDELLCYFGLGLALDDAPPVELGWDDQGHWHPHVLRWTELDRLGRAIAARDPALPHPGLPVLLLARFAPLTDDEDGRLAASLLDAAWTRLGLFPTRPARQRFFDRIDARGAGFLWRRGPRGHVIEQPEDERLTLQPLYTLRDAANDTFPLEALEAMVAECPPPAAPPELPLPARRCRLPVELAVTETFPTEAARFVTDFLHRALDERAAGRASVIGGMSREGVDLTHTLWVWARGPRGEARARVAELLALAGAGGAATIDREVVAAPNPSPGAYVQLFDLRLARWAPGKVRFDRHPLSEASRAAVRAALDHLGFSPPDDDGVRHVVLADGTPVEARFPDLDARDCEGGSLLLGARTPAAAEVLHTLLREARLYAYPPLVAAWPELVAAIDTAWPGAHLAPDAALLER